VGKLKLQGQDKKHYQQEGIWQNYTFSVEFTNWLFQHLYKVYKEKCPKEFIERVIEPECVKKLYSDMFQSSRSRTDDLFYETAVIASEIEQGIRFQECLNSLMKRLKSDKSRSELNEKKIAMALYDFSGGKGQISFRKEDLFLVEQSSAKWLHADKVGESGWVPKNYILIFDKILSEKTARRDYHIEGNNSLSFSRGDHIQIYKESQGWAVGRAGEKIGYFPLKYLEA